ncbi:MAG: VanZ family protein [Anaerovorax sp.]|nr:VanZ family protein [Anaerovorax sp.]
MFDYIKHAMSYLIPGFIATILFLIIYEIQLRKNKIHRSKMNKVLFLILGCYLTCLFSLTISPVFGFSLTEIGSNINLTPFKVKQTMVGNPLQFWGNIFMFIPFGTLLVLLSKKCHNLFITLFLGAQLSVFIELVQLFEIRGTDIDDVMLNVIGTFLGFILGKSILIYTPPLRKKIGGFKQIRSGCSKNEVGSIYTLTCIVVIAVFYIGFAKIDPETPFAHSNVTQEALIPTRPSYSEEPIQADIQAKNAILWNNNTNTILFDKQSEEKIAPASTTKMLTALTALDYSDMQDEVLVGEEIHYITQDASRAWLLAGDRLTMKQLLVALLLPSGNDAAYSVAVYTGRKICNDDSIPIDEAISVFIEAMNEKAAQIGAADSNFIRPDGYDAPDQFTTVHDLACIAKEFCQSKELLEIASSHSISNVWCNGKDVTYYNTNELINPESPYFNADVIGLKTGTSVDAGYCLVSAANINHELYICVVMNSTQDGRWIDSLTLLQAIH